MGYQFNEVFCQSIFTVHVLAYSFTQDEPSRIFSVAMYIHVHVILNTHIGYTYLTIMCR